VRALIDYRAALRERSGVGEYAHQLAAALLKARADGGTTEGCDLTLFSSSWKDRPAADADLAGASVIDRRIPVRVLNFAWHRLGWPPIEQLAGRSFDVVHSVHPLLTPARRAAQVVTIHDLNFLAHPERTRAEIRRDYPALAADHATRADRVIVVSEFTAREVERLLGIAREKISVCPGGGPSWPARTGVPREGYVLFFGTLEPRKNVGALLDAYEHLVHSRTTVAPLILAGKATEESGPWLERIQRAPLKPHVRHIGYVDPARRRELYEGARLLVQPSFEEGFGLPVLEAMTVGVPVVAANRGALPEVLGDAGLLVDPDNPRDLAAAIARLLDDPAAIDAAVSRGLQRSTAFTWERTAHGTLDAYRAAVAHRAAREGRG
jgi:glycosyltransferase involved in cell wall biosynthesis